MVLMLLCSILKDSCGMALQSTLSSSQAKLHQREKDNVYERLDVSEPCEAHQLSGVSSLKLFAYVASVSSSRDAFMY